MSCYNPRSANPFDKTNPFPEWQGNNLILTDPELRRRAGVDVLDSDVCDVFNIQKPQKAPKQTGGNATGLPQHVKYYGHKNSVNMHQEHVPGDIASLSPRGEQVPPNDPQTVEFGPYQPEHPHAPAAPEGKGQTGGAHMAYHYYANNQKW